MVRKQGPTDRCTHHGSRFQSVSAGDRKEDRQGAFELQAEQERGRHGMILRDAECDATRRDC